MTKEELKKGQVVKLKKDTPIIGGQEFKVEGTCEDVFECEYWIYKINNFAINQFLSTHKYNPAYSHKTDHYYGKVGLFGYIVRIDEVEKNEEN